VGPAVGLTALIAGAPNAYRLLLVAALVPAAVLTNTWTVPAVCAGATTDSRVGVTNVLASAVPVEPNFTVAPGAKPAPLIVTVFPPAVGPAFGLTAVIIGPPTKVSGIAALHADAAGWLLASPR
jgi:hypothetical protein